MTRRLRWQLSRFPIDERCPTRS